MSGRFSLWVTVISVVIFLFLWTHSGHCTLLFLFLGMGEHRLVTGKVSSWSGKYPWPRSSPRETSSTLSLPCLQKSVCPGWCTPWHYRIAAQGLLTSRKSITTQGQGWTAPNMDSSGEGITSTFSCPSLTPFTAALRSRSLPHSLLGARLQSLR